MFKIFDPQNKGKAILINELVNEHYEECVPLSRYFNFILGA